MKKYHLGSYTVLLTQSTSPALRDAKEMIKPSVLRVGLRRMSPDFMPLIGFPRTTGLATRG